MCTSCPPLVLFVLKHKPVGMSTQTYFQIRSSPLFTLNHQPHHITLNPSMPHTNRKIEFDSACPLYGPISLRSTSDGRGGGGPSITSATHTAACRYVELRGDPTGVQSYSQLALVYNVSKQSIQQCVQKWESKAQLGDARMLRWFQHQEDRAQESAAAALCRYGLVCVCLLFGTNRLNAFFYLHKECCLRLCCSR